MHRLDWTAHSERHLFLRKQVYCSPGGTTRLGALAVDEVPTEELLCAARPSALYRLLQQYDMPPLTTPFALAAEAHLLVTRMSSEEL